MSSIVIEDYNPLWPQMFEEEKARILTVLGDYAVEVNHVGSTSVPGLGAKPVLDIQVVLPDIVLVEQCVPLLEDLGYGYHGEAGVPGRHFFRKPSMAVSFDERTHHVHVVEICHYEHLIKLLFRDYLRAHPESMKQYEQLKRALAAQFGQDRAAYTEAKADFIVSILRVATEEARARGEYVPDKPEVV